MARRFRGRHTHTTQAHGSTALFIAFNSETQRTKTSRSRRQRHVGQTCSRGHRQSRTGAWRRTPRRIRKPNRLWDALRARRRDSASWAHTDHARRSSDEDLATDPALHKQLTRRSRWGSGCRASSRTWQACAARPPARAAAPTGSGGGACRSRTRPSGCAA